MIDMVNNLNDFMNMYRQLKSNPVQFLSRRFNIPQNISDPNDIVQYLLNTGQVSQDQVNRAMSMKNNPVLQQIMGEKR